MSTALLANTAWFMAGRAPVRRFADALRRPAAVQEEWLTCTLAKNRTCEYGANHDFGSVNKYNEYVARVPVVDYNDIGDYVARIARGEQGVLSTERVTHLVPTSGSSGARKLIPFTTSLSRAFDAAVAPWMSDLLRQRPDLRYGCSYWSISPPIADDTTATIPIGFADDAHYLGAAKAWLVRHAMAVPSEVRHARDTASFWALTLLALLRRRDLRLMSVWHPSFVDLLVREAQVRWNELLDAIASGANPWQHALPAHARGAWRNGSNKSRARELHAVGRENWMAWWPRLSVLSCWGEQAAEGGWARLKAQLPHVLVQPKGLLATEAVVTIPYETMKPVAITSHFFEFRDHRGDIRRAHELEHGHMYEVIVTNGAGLWRYALGDMVECDGHLADTPSLRFLGRKGNVSDLRGEKLSEVFVAESLRTLFGDEGIPRVAYLRARSGNTVAGYELVVDAGYASSDLAIRLDTLLRVNPHYDIARNLGQLEAVQVVTFDDPDSVSEMESHAQAQRARIGDVKPRVLEKLESV